jgi:predicted PurR-regulated permease PerM
MVAVATLERVYQRLIDKTVDILISNAILTFLVAGFMLLVFYYLVTRHLIDIASFIRGQSLEQEGEPLRLDRKLRNKNKSDELELVVDELNLVRDSLQQTFSTLRASIWQSLFTETGLTGLFCLTRKNQVGIESGKLRQSIEIK